jgi:exodeoxyribonuclease V alpha subunit
MPTSTAVAPGYELNGLVERVTFHSEETGFCVLRVKAQGHRDLVTVIGSAPSVSAGEWITAMGDWMVDKEHGRQLKAFHLKTMPPNTREGMEKYLASGMVKDIGPVYAKRMIERFGEELSRSLKRRRALLSKSKGLAASGKNHALSVFSRSEYQPFRPDLQDVWHRGNREDPQ